MEALYVVIHSLVSHVQVEIHLEVTTQLVQNLLETGPLLFP